MSTQIALNQLRVFFKRIKLPKPLFLTSLSLSLCVYFRKVALLPKLFIHKKKHCCRFLKERSLAAIFFNARNYWGENFGHDEIHRSWDWKGRSLSSSLMFDSCFALLCSLADFFPQLSSVHWSTGGRTRVLLVATFRSHCPSLHKLTHAGHLVTISHSPVRACVWEYARVSERECVCVFMC